MSGAPSFNPNNITTYEQPYKFYKSSEVKYMVARQCEYIRERPYSDFKAWSLPVTMIPTGGVLGICAATELSQKMEREKMTPLLQGLGFVGGCTFGAYLSLILTEQFFFFKAWKNLKLSAITDEFLGKNHNQDEFLNQFLDTIHLTPLKVPVRLGSGELIDLSTLKQMSKEGKVVCPTTLKELSVEAPTIELELHLLILKRIQHLLKKQLSDSHLQFLPDGGVFFLLREVEEKIKNIYIRHLSALETLSSDGTISNMAENQLRLEFYTNFGTDPLGYGNDDEGVPAHEMNFNLDWKGIITRHSRVIFRESPETKFADGPT